MHQDQQGTALSTRRGAAKGGLRPRRPGETMPQPQRTTAMRQIALISTTMVALLGGAATALAQENCRNTGNFDRWLAEFKREALAKGISQAAINAASPYLVLDQRII